MGIELKVSVAASVLALNGNQIFQIITHALDYHSSTQRF